MDETFTGDIFRYLSPLLMSTVLRTYDVYFTSLDEGIGGPQQSSRQGGAEKGACATLPGLRQKCPDSCISTRTRV